VRGFGLDAQRSVHECRFSPAERDEIWLRLVSILDPAADRLLMLRLDPRSAVEQICTPPPMPALADEGAVFIA
jgi:CRISPR/Cas system-associated endoribonuclease Cas2